MLRSIGSGECKGSGSRRTRVSESRPSGNRGTLFLVATPIGNLGDVTQRALKVMAEVDVIAAEDTRHTRRLLDHFGIQVPTRLSSIAYF